ncbi:MAG: glycosyltransferase [Marinobacter sp.]|uniref:glycosyltransferase n=1 Tax=Marinobacter sp. TaxID=50741 RepID=UPI00299DDAA5|nr:glycosyltransferase [Marinobacter sp.]MDX1757530.1 glycosyltransferase [Marinobacter sp.]
MKALTVAMVLATPATTWGGMEQYTRTLALALAHRGHALHILAHPDYADRFPAPLIFHPLPVGLGRRNPWLRHRLRQSLRQIRPDLCHAQGNKAAALLSVTTPAGTVSVGTVHGLKSSHTSFRRLHGVIAVSQQVFEGLNHPHKELIHNGLEPAAPHWDQAPATLPKALTRPLVLAAGRLEPVKGFDRLIQAWAALPPPGHLIIAGEGSQRAHLQNLIDGLEATHRVTLAGYCEDLQAWLAQADVVVVSSEREGFGYLVIEALQAGCPVLSPPVGCAPELLPPDCLAADASVAALQALLITHLSSLDGLRDRQADAMRRASTEFTATAMTERTEAWYRALVQREALG